MADVQAQVQALLEELVERGAERGVQVAAYQEGTLVVDACAGMADPATARPVGRDTLFNGFSITKGITATVIHLLAERGALEYDAPVARYWPEYGTRGKGAITVGHVLTHTAGVPQLPAGVGPADLCDWEAMCHALAEETPIWEPGTATGYHLAPYGFILGEVARRVDGRPLDVIVREDLCTPLGLADLHLRLPADLDARVATLESDPTSATPPLPPPDALIWRVLPPALQPLERTYSRPDVRRALLPNGGAIMSARALAHFYAGVIGAAPDGARLLPPERVRVATALRIDAVDRVIGVPIRRALGYHLGGPGFPMGESPTAFGHVGYGGSIGFADPAYRFAFGLVKNRVTMNAPGQGTAERVARTVRAALGIPEAA